MIHAHWGLSFTALSLALIAVWLYMSPNSRAGHLAADAVLVLIPGPIALMIG
jgi:hypothetical protein